MIGCWNSFCERRGGTGGDILPLLLLSWREDPDNTSASFFCVASRTVCRRRGLGIKEGVSFLPKNVLYPKQDSQLPTYYYH